ncbi:MAG: ATP-binding protein, partial [Pseudohongiellaceae bacterium]
GLGLYVSYGLATKHNGTIEAKNNSDKGATFTVTLPIDMHDDD